MSRLKEIRNYVNAELNKMEDEDKRISAISHLYGVSLSATIIAKKRGLDPEIASIAGMLHDLYAYKSGSYDDHAHKGADLAREILDGLKLTDEAETDMICSAIYHHDDKLVEDGPMDEVLKDADVIHHCFNDLSKPVKEKEHSLIYTIVGKMVSAVRTEDNNIFAAPLQKAVGYRNISRNLFFVNHNKPSLTDHTCRHSDFGFFRW